MIFWWLPLCASFTNFKEQTGASRDPTEGSHVSSCARSPAVWLFQNWILVTWWGERVPVSSGRSHPVGAWQKGALGGFHGALLAVEECPGPTPVLLPLSLSSSRQHLASSLPHLFICLFSLTAFILDCYMDFTITFPWFVPPGLLLILSFSLCYMQVRSIFQRCMGAVSMCATDTICTCYMCICWCLCAFNFSVANSWAILYYRCSEVSIFDIMCN